MKRLLAVIMSLVMMFSLAALPVAAAEETPEPDEVTVNIGDVIDTLILTVELIEDTIYQVHNIVGSVLGMLSKECPMCGEVHQVVAEEAPEEELPEELPEEIPEEILLLLA